MERRLRIIIGLLVALMVISGCGPKSKSSIVPLPQKIETEKGQFLLTDQTKVIVDSASEETGRYLAARLQRYTGRTLVVQQSTGGGSSNGTIVLMTKGNRAALGQ